MKMKDNIYLVDHLVLVSSCGLAIAGEHIIQHQKTQCSKYGKTKVSNANWVITENQLKRCFWKEKKTGNDAKKAKKLTSFYKRFYILQNQI